MTADTDREARLEEILERLEAHERGVKGAAHDDEASDLRFLLSEIDRLREIEEAAQAIFREDCFVVKPEHHSWGAAETWEGSYECKWCGAHGSDHSEDCEWAALRRVLREEGGCA